LNRPVFIFLHVLSIYGVYKMIFLYYLHSNPAFRRRKSTSIAPNSENHEEVVGLLAGERNSAQGTSGILDSPHQESDGEASQLSTRLKVPQPSMIIRSTSSGAISREYNNNNNINANISSNNNDNSKSGNPSTATSAAGSSSPDQYLQLNLFSMSWVLFWELLTFIMMRMTFYPEFVIKMFVIFPLVLTVVVASINVCYYILVQFFPAEEDDPLITTRK
jgi:hypothetical protein